jgi:hypothetical protein
MSMAIIRELTKTQQCHADETVAAVRAMLAAAPAAPAPVPEADFGNIAKDAERYRWLRDKSEPPHNFYLSVPVEFHGVRYQPHEVDAYIDAAIAASKGGAA